jgi:hypothetical protein
MDTAMPLSAEEQDILDLQEDLLRQSIDASNSGNALNELLMPILLKEAGYEVEYGTTQTANPRYNDIKRDLKRWEQFVDSKGGKNSLNPDVQNGIRRIEELKAQLKDTSKTLDKQGIIGLTEIADPSRDLRKENERLLLERQGAALRGELPVAPALLSDLDQQEEDLRASLLENLGTGFETSTPGIEALAEFGERKNAILEATRRDDIAGAGAQANQMGGFLESLSGSRSARAAGAGQLPFQNASNLSQIANSLSGPLQYRQNSRMMDFQMSQANNAPGGLESLLYQGAGTASTFGLGKLFGVF